MKNKILTGISAIMLFIVFMIFSGAFTILSYAKAKAQNNLMKVCLIVNSLYAVGGIAALGMMVLPKMM